MKELIKFTLKDGDKDLEFTFVEPSKAVLKEAEIVNSTTFANCVRKGYLTSHEVSKLYAERGGVFTKDEEEDFKKALELYLLADKKLKDSETKDESLVEEVTALKDKVLHYYNRQESIFELTAERKAREVTLWHYALALTYLDGKQYFEGSTFELKQKKFDEAPSELKEEVLKRSIWYATAYVSGVKFDEVPFPEISKVPVK